MLSCRLKRHAGLSLVDVLLAEIVNLHAVVAKLDALPEWQLLRAFPAYPHLDMSPIRPSQNPAASQLPLDQRQNAFCRNAIKAD
jgi:hypothetical protein